MSDNIIQAIIIKLNSSAGNYAQYGVYGGEIRLSESELLGTEKTFTNNLIAKNGIGKIIEKADFSYGGNVTQTNNINIILVNTDDLYDNWLDLGITLYGLIVEIWEFVGSDIDSDSVEAVRIYVGSIENVDVSETEIELRCKASLRLKRKRNIGFVLNKTDFPYLPDEYDGKPLPVMFGKSDPLNNRFYKLLRVNNKSIKLTSEDIVLRSYPLAPSNSYYPKTMTLFPCYDYDDGNSSTMYFIIARVWYTSPTFMDLTTLENLWIHCKEGVSKNDGQFRKIFDYLSYDDVFLYPGTSGEEDLALGVKVALQDYLPATQNGDFPFPATDHSYIEIYDLGLDFKPESETIAGFFNSVTDFIISNGSEVYSVTDSVVSKIMSYGADINYSSNLLNINPRIFNGQINNLRSIEILPITIMYPANYSNLSGFGITDNYYRYRNDGVYVEFDSEPAIVDPTSTGSTNYYDRNYNTYYSFQIGELNVNQRLAFICKLPAIPETFKFKKVYLGIKARYAKGSVQYPEIGVYSRRYFGGPKEIYKKQVLSYDTTELLIENIPDSYYLTNAPSTKNKNYFYSAEPVSPVGDTLSGGDLFDIDVSTKDDYDNIEEILISFKTPVSGVASTEEIRFYELAVIFENENDISKVIYA